MSASCTCHRGDVYGNRKQRRAAGHRGALLQSQLDMRAAIAADNANTDDLQGASHDE
jgi:hypothetical protein